MSPFDFDTAVLLPGTPLFKDNSYIRQTRKKLYCSYYLSAEMSSIASAVLGFTSKKDAEISGILII